MEESGTHIVREATIAGAELREIIAFEPGRYISGNSGILLTRVLYRKQGGEKKFVIADVGMNDLIRPTLYDGYHYIWPTHIPTTRREDYVPEGAEKVDVVGPVCESGDYMAKDREIPAMQAGDLVVFGTAGAYGAVQAGTYNTRPLVPEVLVNGDAFFAIRPRQTVEELIALDRLPPWLEAPAAQRKAG